MPRWSTGRLRFQCRLGLASALAASLLFVHVSAVGPAIEFGFSSDRLGRIHDAIQRHIDAGDVSGAVTLVARRGRIVEFEAHGWRDIESKAPMAKDSIFRWASMSKPVTAVAILMLMEEGKVRLSDPVSTFIPELRDLSVALPKAPATDTRPVGRRDGEPEFQLVPASREIRILDLLTHTSGMVSGGISASEAAKRAPRGAADTLADYIPQLRTVPLAFQPGTAWRYSALAGVETLGRVVEVASGQAFDRFLAQRIFEPLGMKSAGFVKTNDQVRRLVTLYEAMPGGLKRMADQNGFLSDTYYSGAAGLLGTTEDYWRFAQMLANGGTLNGRRILSPRTVALLASEFVHQDLYNGILRTKGAMVFGLTVEIVNNPIAANLWLPQGSFGWSGAHGTQFWIDPKDKLVTIIMAQTPVQQLFADFDIAVAQAMVE